MEQALSDLTVLDLGQVIAMPFCTMLLADMGARVIKVESLDQARERLSLGMKRVRNGVEERVPVYQYRDRNKQAITLNLKTAKGVELFKELVAHIDVVTENFSVGTMDRPGLGYHALKTLNPPTRSGQSISDYYAGMLCAFSIVSALHYRDRTGQGQYIDIALLDSLLIALDNLGERYTVGGEILTRAGNVSFGEVVSTLTEAGVPAAPVNDVAEMVADPQVQARDMFVALEHPTYGPVTITGTPLKLSETPARVERLAPLPGEGAPLNWCPSAHAVAGGITRRFLLDCWATPTMN